jgi:hypothetical protein
MSANAADTVSRRIVDVTADCGISLVASLPDGWITSLITHYNRMHASGISPSTGRNRQSVCVPARSSAGSGHSH